MNILQRSLGVALICAALLPAGSVKATSPTVVIYDSVAVNLPPNIPSLGYEATSTSEFGDHISFAGTDRKAAKVTVTMSAWGYQSEYAGNPDYTNPAGWVHPITLNIYQVVHGSPPTPGTKIGTLTQNFLIPWRPVPDPTCPYRADTVAWRAGDGNCYGGYAFNITFDLTSLNLTLPNEIIFGIAYNTADYGTAPIHVNGPYNSLNVGYASSAPSVGADVNPDVVFWNTNHAPFYTDGGTAGVGTFRADTGWSSPYYYFPAVRFEAESAPPPWIIKGFYQPVDMSPSEDSIVFNTVKNGSTVPLKFEIFNGEIELTDPAAVSTISQLKVNCVGGVDIPLEQEVDALSTTNLSTVRYDTTSGQFIFNWKTPKSKDACYKVTMTSTNGPSISAYFKMK